MDDAPRDRGAIGRGGIRPENSIGTVSELFANTADGVWGSGPQGEILFWNRAAEAIMGHPAEQVVGRLCRDVFGGCDANGNRICGWPCPIKTLLHGGDMVEHFDMATWTMTGQPLWIDVSCVAVPSRDGGLPTIVHLFRDVTVAHQIETLVRRQLAQTMVDEPTASHARPPRVGALSRRELEVVTMMQSGASTADIADRLHISKATVRNHIQGIFGKLNVHTRLEAVAYVNRLARQEPTSVVEPDVAHGPSKKPPRRRRGAARTPGATRS